MADDKKEGGGGNPLSDFRFLAIGFVILLALWWANGGPNRADLRGIFLQPPAPVGGGNAYGPNFYTTTSTPQDAQSAGYGYQGQQ